MPDALTSHLLGFTGSSSDTTKKGKPLSNQLPRNPGRLNEVYKTLYESSRKYLLLVEYYNPTPVEIEYRGHSGKLFKRDFAGKS